MTLGVAPLLALWDWFLKAQRVNMVSHMVSYNHRHSSLIVHVLFLSPQSLSEELKDRSLVVCHSAIEYVFLSSYHATWHLETKYM